MPWTAAQRRLFHASEDPEVAREHGLAPGEARKLADEADKLAREGHERRAKTKKALSELVIAMYKRVT